MKLYFNVKFFDSKNKQQLRNNTNPKIYNSTCSAVLVLERDNVVLRWNDSNVSPSLQC